MINKDGIVYILCTSNFATGGTESLHLLCHTLRKKDIDARMIYAEENHLIGELIYRLGHPGHGNVDVCKGWYDHVTSNGKVEQFNIYDTVSTDKIEDNENNTLIVPEIYLNALNKFSLLKKGIWWLAARVNSDGSYDYQKWFNFNKDRDVYHFYNSKAAEFMLSNLNATNYFQLKTFVNENIKFSDKTKENIICYNPKKGLEFTEKILKLLPEYKHIPINNMTPEQVRDTLSRAKLYIDFGHHPGRERLPREAILCDCCIISSFEGSAMFFEDMPIKESYKFEKDDKNINVIVNLIKDVINDYDTHLNNFKHYKKILSNNKTQFNIDVDNLII